jgi:hypothetical protein
MNVNPTEMPESAYEEREGVACMGSSHGRVGFPLLGEPGGFFAPMQSANGFLLVATPAPILNARLRQSAHTQSAFVAEYANNDQTAKSYFRPFYRSLSLV